MNIFHQRHTSESPLPGGRRNTGTRSTRPMLASWRSKRPAPGRRPSSTRPRSIPTHYHALRYQRRHRIAGLTQAASLRCPLAVAALVAVGKVSAAGRAAAMGGMMGMARVAGLVAAQAEGVMVSNASLRSGVESLATHASRSWHTRSRRHSMAQTRSRAASQQTRLADILSASNRTCPHGTPSRAGCYT